MLLKISYTVCEIIELKLPLEVTPEAYNLLLHYNHNHYLPYNC